MHKLRENNGRRCMYLRPTEKETCKEALFDEYSREVEVVH